MKKRSLSKYPDGGKKKNPQTSIRMDFKKMPSDNLGSYTAPHKYVAPENRPFEPAKLFDPTGISNYGDLIQAIQEKRYNDVPLEFLGSLPAVGPLARLSKLTTKRNVPVGKIIERIPDFKDVMESFPDGGKLGPIKPVPNGFIPQIPIVKPTNYTANLLALKKSKQDNTSVSTQNAKDKLALSRIPKLKEKPLDLEEKVDKYLNNPQKNARLQAIVAGEIGYDPNTKKVEVEEKDNVRHTNAGRYTAEELAKMTANATGNIPYISNALGKATGFLGANALGMAHEASTFFDPRDNRNLRTKAEEALEDMYNNYQGSKIGLSNLTPEEKNEKIRDMSYYNQLPDGYGQKHPFYDNATYVDPFGEILPEFPDGGTVKSINDFNKKYGTNYANKQEFTTRRLPKTNIQTASSDNTRTNYTPITQQGTKSFAQKVNEKRWDSATANENEFFPDGTPNPKAGGMESSFDDMADLATAVAAPAYGLTKLGGKLASKILAKTSLKELANTAIAPIAKINKKAIKTAFEPKSSFKSEIDWAQWNKEIPENKTLMQEYHAIEQKAKADGTWMKPTKDTWTNSLARINLRDAENALSTGIINGKKLSNEEIALFTREKDRLLKVKSQHETYEGTPEQFIQERSSNFKKAYPDGAEKAYRGTYGEMNTESLANSYPKGRGIFTADKKTAQHYAGNKGKLNELYHPKSKNSYDIDVKGNSWREVPTENLPNMQSKKTFLGKPVADTDDIATWAENNNVDYVNMRNIFDGVDAKFSRIVNNKPGNYLKSAVGNNGMFDMTNPNIYKGLIPATVLGGVGAAKLQENAHGGTIMKEYKYGGIHIKPENKGKFTATKKATGKSTEELTHSKNPVTRKRAIFAQNAAKWHHADGGILGETTTAIPPRTLRKFDGGGTWNGVDAQGNAIKTTFGKSTAGSNLATGASIAGAAVPMITSMIPDQTVRDSEGNEVGQKVGTGKAIVNSAASGAAMGASFGGPIGALAGAGIGAIYGGISNSMANKKIDTEMKQANDRISNRKFSNRLFTNNNTFATQDYNNNDMVYAEGGMVIDQHMDDPNAELELNETFQEPSGQVGMVDGPSHDNGGVEVNLEEGTRIWSDKLKHNGKTFAALTRPIVNKIEKLEKTSPTDYNSRFKQNSKMLLNKQLDHLFEVQETNKQQDEMKRSLKNNAVVNDRGNYHYAMGGYIPKYWDGSKIGDKNLDLYSQQVQQPTQYGMDQTYPTYDPQSYQTPERISSRNYGPIGPITEQQMLNQKEAGTAWLNNLGNRFEGDPGASTREWLNKKTVDFTAHPVQKTPEVVVPKRNWFKDNANTMGQLSTLGATLAAQNANVNRMPAPRTIGNVNFQNQIVNPKYMDLSAERAAINRANMGAMDESQRQFGSSAAAQAFKNKARLNQLEGLGKSYQTQENTNASIYNQFAGMQGEAGIKQAMANTDIDRQNAENWYGDKAMRLSNKNSAIATAGHGVGQIFGNNATYANELEKANILANQHEGTVLADMYKNNPRLFNDTFAAGHISPYDYARVTGQLPPTIPPSSTPPTPPTIPPPTTTPPQIGPPQKAYGGIIKRRKLKR